MTINIAPAIPKAIETNTGAREFGKACLKIVLTDEKPSASDACTNSNDRIRKNSALVNLAILVHPVNPIITITIQRLLSTTEVIVIISISLGIEFSNSIPLETNVSIGTVTYSFNFPKAKILLTYLQIINTIIH